MMPMASEIEPGEFMLMQSEPESKHPYLTQTLSVTDVNVTVHAWGTTSKNHINGIYLLVKNLNGSKAPVLEPRRGQPTTPWK